MNRGGGYGAPSWNRGGGLEVQEWQATGGMIGSSSCLVDGLLVISVCRDN